MTRKNRKICSQKVFSFEIYFALKNFYPSYIHRFFCSVHCFSWQKLCEKIRMDPFLVLKNVTGLMGHRALLCVGLKSSQNMLHAFISSSLITPISIYTDTTLTLLWYVIINSSSTTSSSSSLSLDNNKIFPLTKLYESTNKRWKKSFLKNKILFYEFLLHD